MDTATLALNGGRGRAVSTMGTTSVAYRQSERTNVSVANLCPPKSYPPRSAAGSY